MKQLLEGLAYLATVPAVIALVLNLNMCMHGC